MVNEKELRTIIEQVLMEMNVTIRKVLLQTNQETKTGGRQTRAVKLKKQKLRTVLFRISQRLIFVTNIWWRIQ